MRILIWLAILILLSAFFSAAEVAIVSVRKTRLRELIEQGSRRARLVERLAESSTRLLGTIQVGGTLAGLLAAATAAVSLSSGLAAWISQVPIAFLMNNAQPLAVVLITLALSVVVLVFGELVPKTLAVHYAEGIALWAAYPLELLTRLASPFVSALSAMTQWVTRLLRVPGRGDLPFVTEDEIKAIVDAGQEEGVLEQVEKEMIYGIFELGDTLAREVMVPRIDVAALEVGTPLGEAIDVAVRAGHTRLPVYEETIDNIVGILNVKDLLKVLRDGSSQVSLQQILRPAHFIPETNKVDELLKELQQKRIPLAIVVDEYGGTAGLVTIEDILEEIVGEIRDEYDVAEEPVYQKVSDNELIFDARADLDDVNQLLELELPTQEADTLGGLIYNQLGKVPKVGDEVRLDGVTISVLSVVGRRIKKVKLTVEPPAEEPSAD